MKKLLSFCILSLISIANAQIKFEPGYIVNSGGSRIYCLIKNLDWRDNPVTFEYKLSENGEILKADISSVNEFGVPNSFKYIKVNVEIDRSSDKVENMDKDRNPVFSNETLFLKVLIEGKANLYAYTSENLFRYFYKTEDGEIKQLVYKRFILMNDKGERKIGVNEFYKTQLRTDLQCTATNEKIKNLTYKSNPLFKFFKSYNQCAQSEITEFSNRVKSNIHLTVKAGLMNQSMERFYSADRTKTIKYDKQTGFFPAVEVEYRFPFSSGKWSIFAEISHHSYKADKKLDYTAVSEGYLDTQIKYNAYQLGVGGRYYMFLNDDSKLYLSFIYMTDYAMGGNFIALYRADGNQFDRLELDGRDHRLAASVGYKYKDRFSIELRGEAKGRVYESRSYNINRRSLSVILGYSLF